MEIAIMVIGLLALALASMKWGIDSRDDMDTRGRKPGWLR